MAKLYELGVAYNQVYDQVYDGEIPIEDLAFALDSIEGLAEDKIENFAKIIFSMDSDIEAIRSERQRLAHKEDMIEKHKDGIKSYIQMVLTSMGKEKVKTPLFTIYIQNNPQSVNVIDEDALRSKPWLWISQEPKLDKKQILKDLKDGKEIAGVALQQTRSLRIR